MSGFPTGSAEFAALIARERASFEARAPESRRVFEGFRGSLFRGVPMPWMLEWPNPYPLYSTTARGNRLWDVDGNEYLDFCFGDTGAMFGHSPEPVVEAIAARAADGITTMLPSPDAAPVAASLPSA